MKVVDRFKNLWEKVRPRPAEIVKVDEVMNPLPVEASPPKRSFLPTMIVRLLKKFILGYPKDRGWAGWCQPDFDLAEVDKAENVESMLKVSINKYTEKILNCGWQLRGKNPETRAYIRKRLSEFGLVTGAPWQTVFAGLVRDLVKYNNAFLYFRRSSEFSSGRPMKLYGSEVEPIAGVFCIDPTSMRPKTDRYNNIAQWRQELEPFEGWALNGKKLDTVKTYGAHDILHIYRNRQSGFIFGAPDYLPVFDDMRALRQMEDQVELLVHKHTFPLFHVKVGTEKNPALTDVEGVHEVERVKRQFESLAAEGSLVTSERVSVESIGIENKALDISPYLDNFRKRVQLGVYLSDTDIGSGDLANRATARQLSLMFQERCKSIMTAIEQFITHKFFNLLLLENGYTLHPDHIVEFTFNEIDLENRMAINNHAMALFQGHMITRTEARAMCNMPAIERAQEKDMFFLRVAKPLALIQAPDEPYSAAAKKATANRNQPQNQEGTKMAKTQPKNDDLSIELNILVSKVAMKNFDRDRAIEASCELITNHLANDVETGMRDVSEVYFVGTNILPGFSKLVRPKLSEMFDRLGEDLKTAESLLDRSLAAEMCMDDLNAFLAKLPVLARGYGTIRAKILSDGAPAVGIRLNKLKLNDIPEIILSF